MMKNAPSTKLSELAYLVILSLLAVFLLLAVASLCPKGKAIPHQRLLLAILIFSLGYLACLYFSKLIFSPLKRMISRAVNPVRDKSLNEVKGKETAQVSSSLSELMEGLRLSREEAKRWNQELECRVEERTKQLREAQERLIQSARLASLGEMASSIAHEIRNPLAVIATAGGYLKRVAASHEPPTADESSQVEEQLGIMDGEIERVGKIVDGLLRFSRVSISPSHPPRLVNINEMVEEALSQAIQGGGLEGIEVVKEWTFSLPSVRIDPSELQQAFLNIIQNAAQAMPQGGTLTIATRLSANTEHQTPNTVKISFTDTGCGIARENMEKVFEPFFTTKDFGEGTGLGLAIADGIVKRAGGGIKAESNLGKGTVFTIYLPLNT